MSAGQARTASPPTPQFPELPAGPLTQANRRPSDTSAYLPVSPVTPPTSILQNAPRRTQIVDPQRKTAKCLAGPLGQEYGKNDAQRHSIIGMDELYRCVLQTSSRATIVLMGRSVENLNETDKSIVSSNGRALPLLCDVTNREVIHHAIANTFEQLDPIDLLINNAGLAGPIEKA